MKKGMKDEFDFFVTTMPSSRPADYYLGCLGSSVYIDFDNCENQRIRLRRISFDGYGCCNLSQAIPMNEIDSQTFKKIIKAQIPDQSELTAIVKRTILSNREFIWEDALDEYGL